MKKGKLTIIVPVYNVEKYIGRFLESVKRQTYKELEIICINDASTDKSGDILLEYSKRDERIKVIEKKSNMGCGGYYARAEGIRAAQGEYIGFADPDDTIEADFYEKLMEEATSSKADIVCGSTKWVNEKGEVTRITSGPIGSKEVKKEFGKILESLEHGALWDKIYKKGLIDKSGIKFHGYCGEDNLFTIESLYYSKKIATVKEAYYRYYQYNSSSVGNNEEEKATEERIEGVFFVAGETIRFIEEKFEGNKNVRRAALTFLEKSLLGRIKHKKTYINRIYNIFGLFFITRYILKKVGKVFYRNYVNRFGYHKVKVLYIPIYSKKVTL